MTEILDADADANANANDGPAGAGTFRSAVHAALEPAALAVAAGLAVVCAAAIGPSYPFHSYPFNQGVTSLDIYNQIRAQSVHPLRDFLYNSAPMIFFTVVALGCAVGSLSRRTCWAWARPVAAGALLIGVAFVVVVAAGAYRASTWDLAIPDPNAVTTTG